MLAPVLADIVLQVLRIGIFPRESKSAIVLPLLKKQGRDHDVFRNFRPVSNLSVISKVTE